MQSIQIINSKKFYINIIRKNFSEKMSVFNDVVAGMLSGIVQVLVMQPFQTIKIRLVNQSVQKPDYNGIIDCFKQIMGRNGIQGFYQGTLSPLIGVGPQVAMQFATNQFVKRALRRLNERNSKNSVLSLEEALVSGFLTGIPSAFIVTPIDLLRIQMQTKDAHQKYKGSIDAGYKIITKQGIKGVYLGIYPTLLREMIALSVYFGSYEYWKNRYIRNSGEQDLPLIASFFLGGISGAASWLFTYPIDYVKTLIQSQNIEKKMYRSSIGCSLIKYREEGFKTFFKGLGVTMLRSFPVNGAGFVAFEVTMNSLGRQSDE